MTYTCNFGGRHRRGSLAYLSSQFCIWRDARNLGASDTPLPPVYQDSLLVGYIAYNGRVFAGKPQQWTPVTPMLFDNRAIKPFIPAKPVMCVSRELFHNQHYAASLMKDGSLIVQNLRRGTGKRLIGDSVKEWGDAIEHALDAQEANDLCRGFLS